MSQSSELTGGAGFTFGDAVAAKYFVAMLTEGAAPGLSSCKIIRVALERAGFGEPLDDLIVDGTAQDGSSARLSLQVKSSLTISEAKTNTDFRDVILKGYKTIQNTDFQIGKSRVGVAAGIYTSTAKTRDLRNICDWARYSATPTDFKDRFAESAPASVGHRAIINIVRTILSRAGIAESDEKLHQLFCHLVILAFDFLHEDSMGESDSISLLQPHLIPADAPRAADVWKQLRTIAREGAGNAAVFDRPSLLRKFSGTIRFIGAPSLRHDLGCLSEMAWLALADIPHEIDGFEVMRPSLITEAKKILEEHQFVQIIGLPGTGKSAVLRALAERYLLEEKPIIFLKSDRLSGVDWPSYSRSKGLTSSVIVTALLSEIVEVGAPILFIDGLDRIEPAHRPIILDLLNAILKPPLSSTWRIIATVRDNGIEPIRDWLPANLLEDGRIGIAEVGPFNDIEAEDLAEAKPTLRPLLFGDDRVKEIVRRPFFASIIARSFPESDASFLPRSEIELIKAWWKRGGYDASTDGKRIAHRQRALVHLAQAGAMTLGRRMKLDGPDLDAIVELKQDDILKDVLDGHTIQFAHDIFFEWSFVQLLISKEEKWLEEIQNAGEPPVLARSVELLSQANLLEQDNWEKQLEYIENTNMRSQWARAWLLGPFGSANFYEKSSIFTDAVFRGTGQRLSKLAVWFQAEKTRANPLVLQGIVSSGNASRLEIIRFADTLAWPSDLETWARYCDWLLGQIKRCPVDSLPDILSVFEVWQNALADLPNETSKKIIRVVQEWLEDIEDHLHSEKFQLDRGAWNALDRDSLKEFEDRLRNLFLRPARTAPEKIRNYLLRIKDRRLLRGHALRQILVFSPILSEQHSTELSDLTLAELRGELPADEAAQPSRGMYHKTFDFTDWRQLAIHDYYTFFPPSPLREPFFSLLKNAPQEGLRLVRGITNHAITAWRQLHKLDPSCRFTPLPLNLKFPWGTQLFWGDVKVYQWYRGHSSPPASVKSALMTLENWALKELKAGKNADDVIKDVVSGHESCAILGIANVIALTAGRASWTTLPLATSQHLWHWDLERFINDQVPKSDLFDRPEDLVHTEAVVAANKQPTRQIEIRQLAQLLVHNNDPDLSKAAQNAIKNFPNNLPFETEEARKNNTVIDGLHRKAEIWSESGKTENYKIIEDEASSAKYIQLNNPRDSDPEVVAAVENYKTMNDHLALIMWALDSIKDKALSDRFLVSDAILKAKALDSSKLFSNPHGSVEPDDDKRNVIAGVAATTICYGIDTVEASDIEWAKDVLLRASKVPEKKSTTWFAGAKLMHHPCIFAVFGLKKLALSRSDRAAKNTLLELAVHPLAEISNSSIQAILSLWESDPNLAWAILGLSLKIAVSGHHSGFEPSVPRERQAWVKEIIQAQDNIPKDKVADVNLPAVPDVWVFASRKESYGRSRKNPPKSVWRSPDIFFHCDYVGHVLTGVPVEQVLKDQIRGPAFSLLIDQLIHWTCERLSPSWLEDGSRRDEQRGSRDLQEWQSDFYWLLAKIAFCLPLEEVKARFLVPFFALHDDIAMCFMRDFVDHLTRNIMDEPIFPSHVILLLEDCLARLLKHSVWKHALWRDGSISGYDLPDLIKSLLFVQVKHAGGAARFANGDWSEIEKIMPIVDPFVQAVGDIPSVMHQYLTLCERAIEHYPPTLYVKQVIIILQKQKGTPVGWRGTTIASRIASLIHGLATRTQPLPQELAQDMLRILDALIDMGDRRSAALQISELFKDIRVSIKQSTAVAADRESRTVR